MLFRHNNEIIALSRLVQDFHYNLVSGHFIIVPLILTYFTLHWLQNIEIVGRGFFLKYWLKKIKCTKKLFVCLWMLYVHCSWMNWIFLFLRVRFQQVCPHWLHVLTTKYWKKIILYINKISSEKIIKWIFLYILTFLGKLCLFFVRSINNSTQSGFWKKLEPMKNLITSYYGEAN